jgi:methyl-accepting chemotaxis protein
MMLRSKILSSFCVVAAIAVGVGTVGYFGINKTSALLDEASNELLPSVESLGDIQLGIAQVRSAQNLLLLTGLTAEQREGRFKNVGNAITLLEGGIKTFDGMSKTNEEQERWKTCQAAIAVFRANSDAFAARRKIMDTLIAEKKDEELAKFQTELQTEHLGPKAKEYRAAIEAVDKVIAGNHEKTTQARAESAKAEGSAKTAMFAGMAIGAGAAFGLGLWLASSIISSVTPLAARAKQIAAGDLSGAPLAVTSSDEIGQTISSVNGMSKSLRELVRSVSATAGQVASAATQIAASSDEAASGASSQSQQIQQIAAAVEQLSSTVGEVNR